MLLLRLIFTVYNHKKHNLMCFRSLLKLFNEIHYWERLLFEIPHFVNEVYAKREELRTLREHVLLVVR